MGRLWAALGLTGVYSGCVMIGEPPLLVSGPASNYFRIRALLSTPDFGLRGSRIVGRSASKAHITHAQRAMAQSSAKRTITTFHGVGQRARPGAATSPMTVYPTDATESSNKSKGQSGGRAGRLPSAHLCLPQSHTITPHTPLTEQCLVGRLIRSFRLSADSK